MFGPALPEGVMTANLHILQTFRVLKGYLFILFLRQMQYRGILVPLVLLIVCWLGGCANIVPPQGGERDVTPPRLLSVSPADSLLNTKVTEIELKFDEFIVVTNPSSEVTISPILPFPLTIEGIRRTVTVSIPDTLLLDNTTYRISFGKAIQDLNENNPFTGYSYIFSTGSYFDTLSLTGYVIDAATGLRDTGALVVLYDAVKSDSAIVREKPLYAVKADGSGNFTFHGLPDREFMIYALRDQNNNMIYDGGSEMVAFADSTFFPADSNDVIRLSLFTEEDTSGNLPVPTDDKLSRNRGNQPAPVTEQPTDFSYTVMVDTSNTNKRTVDITEPIEVRFTRRADSFNINRINLSYDSAGITMEADVRRVTDTSKPNSILLSSNWKENTLYTLRLLKGFVKDSANEAMPGRYTFRTKQDDDYAKLNIHLPGKYFGTEYLFVLLNGTDTVYHRPVADTMVRIKHLLPGSYQMRVIHDSNKNGKWDTGDLLDHRQPEEVIPYTTPINLKAGWENSIDFEQAPRLYPISNPPDRGTTPR